MSIIFLITAVTIITFALTFYYVNYYRPRRDMRNQTEQFVKNNWNVFVDRFACMSTAVFDITEKSFQDHEDSLYVEKYQMSEYDVYIGNIGNRVYIQLRQPQLIKEFFLLDNEKSMMRQDFFTRPARMLAGDAISFAEAELWKYKRKIISQFFNYGYLEEMVQKIYHITKVRFEMSLKQNCLDEKRNGQGVSEIYLQNLVEMIPSSVIVELFFGGKQTFSLLEIDGEVLPLFMRNTFRELHKAIQDPIVKIFGMRFLKLRLREKDRQAHARVSKWRAYVRHFILDRVADIEEKRTKKQNEGMLKKDDSSQAKPKDITQGYYQDFERKGQKSKQRIIELLTDDFADLLIAGTETSTLTIIMAIYYLHQNQDAKNILIKELQTVQNEDLRDIKILKKLKYLECVILESLRLHQIASTGVFPRRALKDLKIGGVTIKKGSVIAMSTFAVHYKNEVYEDAKSFRPQRWMQENGDIKSPDSNFFLSFGSGIRNCVGKPLALIQTRLITAYFIKNFDAQFETLDLKLNLKGGEVYEPQPIKMKFWRRSNEEK